MDEDPTIIVTKNSVTKETLVSGMGDQHIEIIMERMKRKFGVEADLRAPIVEYRETIRGTAEVEGKHKKQSGGHGQYGHVVIKMEPCRQEKALSLLTRFSAVLCRGNIFRLLKKVCVSPWNTVFWPGIR